MGKVIFNADDFGYSRGVNYAIVDAHEFGILTSTTIMANMPGFDHAVELSKRYPNLGIGVHLTLTCGSPLLNTHKTLVTKENTFKNLEYFANHNDYDLDELYDEWDAQIKKVYASGITPTHLDSHHHVHSFQKNQELVIRLARKYNLPVRNNLPLPQDIKKVHRFETEFDQGDCRFERSMTFYLNNLIQDIITYESVEVMCHPGYLDATVFYGSSLHAARMNITDFLIHSEFSKKIKEHPEIELISYRTL